MSTMVIGLASGSVEKLLVASTLTGGAVALDMDVEIYLLLGGAYAFRKDVAGKGTYVERPELEEEMLAEAEQLHFERAAELRDEIKALEARL